MTNYTHLDQRTRELIAHKYNNEGLSIRRIARDLCRSPSTISREINRNKAKAHNKTIYTQKVNSRPVKIVKKHYFYDPQHAHTQALKRVKTIRRAPKIVSGNLLYTTIENLLHAGYKPDIIAGRLHYENPTNTELHISHESIYHYIYSHPETCWWEYLRKARKKRSSQSKRRSSIPGRVSYKHRPVEANERAEIGHFEGDTVVGPNGSLGVIATVVDRYSRMLFSARCSRKTTHEVIGALTKIFGGIPGKYRKTLTLDNGTEFHAHQDLSAQTGVEVFFADPYSSWQRGTNERHNGLLRAFCLRKPTFL